MNQKLVHKNYTKDIDDDVFFYRIYSMNFKIRKIKHKKQNLWQRFLSLFKSRKTIVILFLGFILVSAVGLSSILKPSDHRGGRSILSLSPLERDRSGHTNILLLGVAGINKEGGNLSDSILLASINPKGPSVSFLSFPRDIFISSSVGDHKINEIYARGRSKAIAPYVKNGVLSMNELPASRIQKAERSGLSVVKKAVSEFTGIPIHYGIVINFDAFEEVIDTLGGLDIFIREDIEDPFYPDGNYGYETFTIRRGLQHLDGKMALKYARSRKTSSDFNRAQRQQDLLMALREKADKKTLLTDFKKLKEFYNVFQKNVNMDLGMTELIALAKIGVGIDYQNSLSAVLNDDPTKKGGLLYSPAREFYGGQFVLLPKSVTDMQKFIDLLLIHPEVLLEKAQISILNGSGIQGEATRLADRLKRLGLHVTNVGNADNDIPLRTGYFRNISGKNIDGTSEFLSNFLRMKEKKSETPVINNGGVIDLEIVIGEN